MHATNGERERMSGGGGAKLRLTNCLFIQIDAIHVIKNLNEREKLFPRNQQQQKTISVGKIRGKKIYTRTTARNGRRRKIRQWKLPILRSYLLVGIDK